MALIRIIIRAAASVVTFVLVTALTAWAIFAIQGGGLEKKMTHPNDFERINKDEDIGSGGAAIAFICGLVAGASLWVPTATRPPSRHRR